MIFAAECTRAHHLFAFDLFAFFPAKDNETAAVIMKLIDFKVRKRTRRPGVKARCIVP